MTRTLFSRSLAALALLLSTTAASADSGSDMVTVELTVEDDEGGERRVHTASLVLVNSCSSVSFHWATGEEDIRICPAGGDAQSPILSFDVQRVEGLGSDSKQNQHARVSARVPANTEVTVVQWQRPQGATRIRATWH